jgi:hypothetical protein
MSYIKTNYTRGIVSTLSALAGLPTLTPPELGETAFCSENGRLMTYDGQFWMCDDFIKLTNNSGAIRNPGDVMIFESTSGAVPNLANITTSLSNELVAGVVIYTSFINSPVVIAYKGIYRIKCVFTAPATNIGYRVRTSSSATFGDANNTTTNAGIFAYTLEAPSTSPSLIKCLLRNKVEYT